MTGILLVALFLVWLTTCLWLSRKIVQAVPKARWPRPVRMVIVALLFPLPVMDELLAKSRFEALCQTEAVLVLDKPSAQARTVWFGTGARTKVSLGLLDAIVYRKQYVEKSTGEAVYHYSTVTATGGRLIRTLGISPQDRPLAFEGECVPAEFSELEIWRRNRAINEVPRPISN